MTKTTIFENINWSEHANDEIKIIEEFTPSNDYEGTLVVINGQYAGGSSATRDAVITALGEELGEWILGQMARA